MSALRQVARGVPGAEWRRIYTVPNAGAGNDVTFPVPGKKYWQLLSVSGLFTASASAGNRIPALSLEDTDGTVLCRIPSPTAITANLAPVVSWTPGIGAAVVVAASSAALTLPCDYLMGPQEIVKLTGHTDAGDTWTNVRIAVLEVNNGDIANITAREQAIRDHWRALTDLFEHL